MNAWEVRGGELRLRDVEPPPTLPGETLIQVAHTGICGSDVPKLLHPNDFDLPQPWRPGHEIVGTTPSGQLIAVDALISCRHCEDCLAGNVHLCPTLKRIGWDLPGGLAEQVAVPASNVHALPNGLDPLLAVLADPAAVAVHGLGCHHVGGPGRLAIIGAGTVGLLTALYAEHHGWIVTVVHRTKHPPVVAIRRAFGARFRSSTDPPDRAFDIVIDAASGADSAPLTLALRLVRDGGTVVVQNAYHPGVELHVPLRDIFRRSVRLIGSFSYCRRSTTLSDFAIGLSLLAGHPRQASLLIEKSGNLTSLKSVVQRRSSSGVRRILSGPA